MEPENQSSQVATVLYQAEIRCMFVGRMASVEVAGAVMRNTLVGVSPALDTGILGEDFFSRYDVVVKKSVVEFRQQQ